MNKQADCPGSTPLAGILQGLTGVIIFSGSLPATRIAVQQMDPLFLTFCRAAIAGLLALLLVFRRRAHRTKLDRRDICGLLTVAAGVVIGFPLLSALALQQMSASHSIIFLALLPLMTALCAVLLGAERPAFRFWIAALCGSALVGSFSVSQPGSGSLQGDALMLAAVAVCGLGYAEGARLSRRLGGLQVICLALIFCLPLTLPVSLLTCPLSLTDISIRGQLALGYVSLFSMLIGFIFWYQGLATGGIAVVGQLQLLQPFFGLMLSALLLGETLTLQVLAVTAGVIVCVVIARR
ncbi:DMT family transporter [Tatumella sp. UBA2305]|uniref:DMT family transporter n=1 Tax=Tatumella sp. UBA2305 TaxID=1947647 RepID=UPI0025D62D5E|nr:DMT family transporter [Tatumella sp. UBA2305]